MPRLPHPRTALSALADGRLGPLRTWSVRRHLARCTRCELEVAQIRSLRRLLAAPEPPPMSPELLSRLLDIGGVSGPGVPAEPFEPVGPPASRVPAARHRGGVGAAGVLVAGVVLLGAAGAGAAMTAAPGTWQGAGARASLSTVLPSLFPGETRPAGADGGRPTDNGSRP